MHTAVVILNWNGKHYLERFLPGVIRHSKEVANIVVVDNASTDGSVAYLRSTFGSGVRLIELEENLGYAGGYAAALKQVHEYFLVLLNSDVEVGEGWLEPLVARFVADDNLAALQPKILDLNKRNTFEYAGASGGFIDAVGIPFCRGRIMDVLEEDTGQYNEPIDVFWASGACLMVRNQHYVTAGGLDPDLFAHMEEIDLCWRMQLAGFRVAVEPSVSVYHLGGGTLNTGSPFKTYLNYRNGLLILIRNLSVLGLFTTLPLRVAQDALSAWYCLLQGDYHYFLAVLKAHWHVLLRLSCTLQKRSGVRVGQPKGVYRGSIVFGRKLFGKTKFSQLGL